MSAAEEIAVVNPAARVVKAFNTTFEATLEAFQLLHMTLQGPLGLDWASAIKLLPLCPAAMRPLDHPNSARR